MGPRLTMGAMALPILPWLLRVMLLELPLFSSS